MSSVAMLIRPHAFLRAQCTERLQARVRRIAAARPDWPPNSDRLQENPRADVRRGFLRVTVRPVQPFARPAACCADRTNPAASCRNQSGLEAAPLQALRPTCAIPRERLSIRCGFARARHHLTSASAIVRSKPPDFRPCLMMPKEEQQPLPNHLRA